MEIVRMEDVEIDLDKLEHRIPEIARRKIVDVEHGFYNSIRETGMRASPALKKIRRSGVASEKTVFSGAEVKSADFDVAWGGIRYAKDSDYMYAVNSTVPIGIIGTSLLLGYAEDDEDAAALFGESDVMSQLASALMIASGRNMSIAIKKVQLICSGFRRAQLVAMIDLVVAERLPWLGLGLFLYMGAAHQLVDSTGLTAKELIPDPDAMALVLKEVERPLEPKILQVFSEEPAPDNHLDTAAKMIMKDKANTAKDKMNTAEYLRMLRTVGK